MEAQVQPCELHLDGGDQDLVRLAESFTADLVPIGRSAHRLQMDNQWAYGHAVSLGLPLGMRMLVQDLHGREAITLPIRHAPTSLEFSFCRGKGITARTSQGQSLSFSGAAMRVSSMSEVTSLEYRAEEGANEHSIHLNLSPENLQELLGVDALPASIATLLSTAGALNFFETRMDGAVLSLTDEVFELAAALNSERLVSGRLLQLQAKAMELIALTVERTADAAREETPLLASDVRCLRLAREILIENLDHPPSVLDLARRVGLGEKRLKTGFKQLFGTPVMTYHRRLKLERARELLVARVHNVTEVATLIGYANPSKFAAAYRREFGESPSFALTGAA